MEQKKLKIGFVGCGIVSEWHCSAVKKCHNAELVAVTDINEEVGRAKASKWGVSFVPTKDICSMKDIDIIFVLTPTDAHYEYVKQALLNGKHVLVEKPVSMNPEEIEDMIRMSEEAEKVCFPGHSYIYLPELQRMKRIIDQGVIGKQIYMYMSEIQFTPSFFYQIYRGPLHDVFCHQLYLMLAYMGVPRRIQAFASCIRKDELPSGDEQVSVNVDFESGATAQLFASWACEDETSEPWNFKLKVLGTKGGLHFSKRDVVNIEKEGYPLWNFPMYMEMIDCEVDYFINRCILKGEKPISTLRDAANSIRILNLVFSSIKNGRVETLVL